MEFKCKNCGGKLTYKDGTFVSKCDFCGTSSLIFDFLDKDSSMYNEFEQEIIEQKEIFEKRYSDYADDVLNAESYCLTAEDFEKIIDFFESAGDYKNSQKLLPLAKFEFCRKISSFNESLKALKYLDEIAGELELDKEKLRQTISELGTFYRVTELSKENITVITPSTVTFNTVLQLIRDLLLATDKDLSSFNEFDRELAYQSKNSAVDFINKNAEKIIDDTYSKDDLASFLENLSYLSQKYPTLTCSTIIAEIEQKLNFLTEQEKQQNIENARILEEENRLKKRKGNIKIFAFIVVAIIAILVVIFKISDYSSNKVVIKVNSKTNERYNENLANGNYNAGYFYNFELDIKNNSNNGIDVIKGALKIEDNDGRNLASCSVELYGVFEKKSSNEYIFTLNVPKGEDARQLWNADLDDLKITFRIKSIRFDDGTIKNYSNAKSKVIN